MLNKLYLRFCVFSLCLILIFIFGNLPSVQAQSVSGAVKLVRFVEVENLIPEQFYGAETSDLLGMDDTIAFPPGANTLLKLNDPEAEGVSLEFAAPPASVNGRTVISSVEINDPINIALDTLSPGAKGFDVFRLFLADRPRQLESFAGGPQGELVQEGSQRVNVQGPRVADPQGATLDPNSGAIYILDAVEHRIVRLTSKMARNFDGALASSIKLSGGLGIVRGLAFNPETNYLYTINTEQKTLYELTLEGELVSEFDIPFVGKLQGMAFSPSLDLTDNTDAFHLFLAAEIDSKGNKGEVTEWVLPESLSLRANFLEE